MATIAIQQLTTGTHDALHVPYHVMDDGDPPATITRAAAISQAQTQFGVDGFGTLPFWYDTNQLSNHSYVVTFHIQSYVLEPRATPTVGSTDYHVNFNVSDFVAKSSLATISTHFPPNFQAPPNFGSLIGFRYNGQWEHTGVQIQSPVTDVVEHHLAEATWTQANRREITDRIGKVNTATILGYERGDLLFVSFSSHFRAEGEVTLRYGFSGKPRYNLTVELFSGPVTINNLEGHFVPWMPTGYKAQAIEVGGGEIPIPGPLGVIVSRVFEYAGFSNLPGL